MSLSSLELLCQDLNDPVHDTWPRLQAPLHWPRPPPPHFHGCLPQASHPYTTLTGWPPGHPAPPHSATTCVGHQYLISINCAPPQVSQPIHTTNGQPLGQPLPSQSAGLLVSHPPHFHWSHAVGIAAIPHHHWSSRGLTTSTPIVWPSDWPPVLQLASHQVGHPQHNWSASRLAILTSNPLVAHNHRCYCCSPPPIAGL